MVIIHDETCRFPHNGSPQDALLNVWTCLCAHPPASLLLRHTARLLIGGNQQEASSGREGSGRSATPQAYSYHKVLLQAAKKKILRPRLCSKLWAYGEIGTNPRSLLPHVKSHSFQIFRKYSAEGIGVRMAAYKLVLIRHGESSWNQENRFCGWFDADLSETGQQEAKRGGQALKGTR